MVIKFIPGGDIFTSEAEALVNPVNCVGVMGKGLAKEFKARYPNMFAAYWIMCKKCLLKVGTLHTYHRSDIAGPRLIINFPTKYHWREASVIETIEAGLKVLAGQIIRNKIRSIAIPMLGCGEGGLSWADVRPLIVERLGDLDCEIEVYGE